jgi:hypothetical protein
VVDLYELEIRGYYAPDQGSGGQQQICSENVLMDKEASGGVIITASDTEVTSDILSQSSPNALIDGNVDCQMRTRWRSSASGTMHSIFIQTMNSIHVSQLVLTAPYSLNSCSGGDYNYYFYVYGSNNPDTEWWSYINFGYSTVSSGQNYYLDLSVSQPYKHYKIEFYQNQVDIAEIALRGCYYPNWHLENENSIAGRLKGMFGSTAVGTGVIAGVSVFVVLVIVGVAIFIRKRRANAQKDEEELEVINDNYQKM